MRRTAIVLTGIALTGTLLLAGATPAAEVATTAGSRALLFDFQGLDNLGVGSFEGGIGLRWYLKDGLALRPAVGYGWQEDERDPYEQNDIQYSGAKQSSDLFELTLVLEKRLPAHGAVAPYLGIGFEVQSSTYSTRNAIPADPPDGIAIKQVRKRRGWGALAVVGFEYAVLPAVTLGGEYRLSYLRTTGETKYYRQGEPVEERDDGTRQSLGTTTASLFLAVAF